MNRHRTVTLVALALLFLAPLTADAGGAITGLDVSPKGPVTAGTTVDITIKGADVCDELLLDFGDGTVYTYTSTPGELFTPVVYTFPILTSHLYCDPGTFQIQAKPKKACVGEGSASLTVQGEGCLAALHKAMEGASMKTPFLIPSPGILQPHISGLTDGSNITPGGAVGIKGHGFGNEQGGKDVVLLLKKANGTLAPLVDLKIFDQGWSDTLIVGTIPDWITEVPDQTTALSIIGEGKESDPYPVKFKATKDMKQLPPSDVQVSCSDQADSNVCNGVWIKDWWADHWPCGVPFTAGASGTFTGFHWTCVGSSSGTDSFSASLKNGWTFDQAAWGEQAGATMSGFQSGATSMNVSLDWDNKSIDYTQYAVVVTIVGPKGVPHK